MWDNQVRSRRPAQSGRCIFRAGTVTLHHQPHKDLSPQRELSSFHHSAPQEEYRRTVVAKYREATGGNPTSGWGSAGEATA